MILNINEFFALRQQLPVVDVRSEGEFAQGHIRSAYNIPLLNNAERIVVGTTYKQQGQKQAIKEGFRLVGPRLTDIITAAEDKGHELIVHCWRGGMRSSNFCQFVGMTGIKTHQLKGGYKAYRLHALEAYSTPLDYRVISGLTGSGKSDLLRTLAKKGEQVIDLESLANHKGSVFGGLTTGAQPTTEQFQNDLYESIRELDPSRPVWLEDESIAIGKIFLPNAFWNRLRGGKITVIDVPKEVRVIRLTHEYGTVPPELFHNAMLGITKKLGGQNYLDAKAKLFAGDLAGAIEIILSYYDKAYSDAVDRKRGNVSMHLSWNGVDIDDLATTLITEQLKSKRILVD